MPAVVDLEKCDGCCDREEMLCVYNCAYDAILILDNKPTIDETLCDDCKMCVDACPVCAITTI